MQVALLFLARDEIHTEAIWTAFFATAAELTLKRNVPPTAPLKAPILPPTAVGNACTPTDSTVDSPNSQGTLLPTYNVSKHRTSSEYWILLSELLCPLGVLFRTMATLPMFSNIQYLEPVRHCYVLKVT